MAIPSRVLGAGLNSLATISVCGDGVDDFVAAGTSAGDATAIQYVYTSIDTAPSGSGVILPTTEAGSLVIIANSGAHTVTVYAQTGSTINNGTTALIPKDYTTVLFAVSNTAWFSLNGTRT